jgi:glycosyltransferase involved in cell wall biosynthesis
VKTLVVWGRGTSANARRRGEDATVLLWDARGEEALKQAGVPFTRASTLLTEEDRDAADEAAIAWTKAWGKRPLEDGVSFAQRLAWKGVSLWWFAELYLHHSTRGPARVRTIEHFFRVLERLRPEEVEAVGLEEEEALLLGRVCSVLGILFEGPRRGRARAPETARTSMRSRWNTAKAVLGGFKARLGGLPPAPAPGPATVLFLSHAAFWRERSDTDADPPAFEHYFDRLIPAVAAEPGLQPYVVAVGPRAAFRRRGAAERWREWLRPHGADEPFVHVTRFTDAVVQREVRAATRVLRGEWRRLRHLPALAQAFAHRGVSFADLSSSDLAGIMLLQLPWAVLAYEQTRALLRHVRPRVLSLYAESSGWGRAALAACAAEGVPSLALQHGILYPKYFSYRHPPDEADCPRPDRTAVFGEAARRFLVERGGYAAASLVLTGSPKFDQLLERVERWDRAALRRRLGLEEDEPVLLVASRYRAIRDTHHAIGAALPALARAVDELGARCLIKPHPAEPAAPYERVLRETAARGTSVMPPASDLLELLHAADVLVTVESLSAVEALVLGRPVVVLEMPTHLRDLVEAGVAVGVAAGADPGPALWSVLRDPDTRAQLDEARERYLTELALGVDGRATERILNLVREMAGADGATDRTTAGQTAGPGTPPSAPV